MGVKNEKSNLFASSTSSWCTLGLNQAAIEAKEIEAQLRHAYDRWPLDTELLQDRYSLAEHRVVSGFAVHLCPGTQNWFLEKERLPRPGLSHFDGKFAIKWPSWRPDVSCKMLRRHPHRHQERPTGGRTKTSDATFRIKQRSCLHFCTGCGSERRRRIPFRSHHQLSKNGEKPMDRATSDFPADGSWVFSWKTRTLVDHAPTTSKTETKRLTTEHREESRPPGTLNPWLQWARIEGTDQSQESSRQSCRAEFVRSRTSC